MKKTMGLLALLIAVLWSGIGWAEIPKKDALNAKEPDNAAKVRIQENYGNIPLYFIKNDGQVDKKVKYYEKGSGHATYFTKDGIYLNLTRAKEDNKPVIASETKQSPENSNKSFESEVVKLTLKGANKNPKITAIDEQAGKVNYFVGNDKSKWKTNIPTYGAVLYKEVYKGIDVKYYGNNHQLEYDVVVKPGADPKKVQFAYEGVKDLKVTEAGDLEIALKEGNILQKKPYIYQEIDGKRVEIDGRFVIAKSPSPAVILSEAKNLGVNTAQGKLRETSHASRFSYGFEVASYDKTKDLIIDPYLVYSTYLGGSGYDYGVGIAVDSSGNGYVTGPTYATDFPTAFPIQGATGGNSDVFVTKINASGTVLVYSTYLGGSGDEGSYLRGGHGIAVDSAGNAYVTGYTMSTDFPTASPIQGANAGGFDAFVTKIDSTGTTIIYSTYLGGGSGNKDDRGYGIAVDSSGNAYVTGYTGTIDDFPTVSPIQATRSGYFGDAFVTKINASGTTLVYSTYLGGSLSDVGTAITVDSSGNAYITGMTESWNFPIASPIQPTLNCCIDGIQKLDAFITKINTSGTALVYSTYLGGNSYDYGYGIAVDSSGSAYVTGITSSNDFPTANALDGTLGGVDDAFVIKLNASGSALSYSTYLGGNGYDRGYGIAVDSSGNAYVTGETYSTDFLLASPIQRAHAGGYRDAFVTKINASGAALVYSTYLGGSGQDCGYGIAADSSGNAYVTGVTYPSGFPTASPLYSANAGSWDAFVTKMTTVNTAPMLSLSSEAGYGTDGVNPDSGTASSTSFTYKVVYTEPDNNAPSYIRACIDGTCNAMSLDTAATSALHDGNYANGEQYVYTTTLAVGSHNYYFDASDGIDTTRLPSTDTLSGPTVASDATPPTGTITINSGAAYTNTTSATLTLSCTDTSGCSEMQVSNDNTNWSTAEAYATSKAWTLDTGDGTKTVYVKFRDGAGNWSGATISDTIILDTTPPTITSSQNPPANANGWNNTEVTITFTATDAVSSVLCTVPTSEENPIVILSLVPNPSITLTNEGANRTVTTTCTDAAGNSATASHTVNIDKTAPTVTIIRAPEPNSNGWNNTDVNVEFTATDNLSGIQGESFFDVSFTLEGAAQSITHIFTDRAGNSGSTTVSNINIDKTAPIVSVTRTPEPNPNGWNNTDVTAHFTATGSLSGIQGDSFFDVFITTEGAGQSATYSFTDLSGNIGSATISNINIDKTPPILTLPSFAASYTLGSSLTISFSATDSLSLIETMEAEFNGTPITDGASVTLTQIGVNTFSMSAADRAGNNISETRTFTVNYSFGGFLSPLVPDGTYNLGRVIPVKFALSDANGNQVSSAVARLSLQQISGGEPVGEPIEASSVSSADSGNIFRYNGDHYIYNLDTRPLSAGIWQMQVMLDDGSVHTIQIGLKSK